MNRDDKTKMGTGTCLGHGASPADVLKLKPVLEKQEQDAVNSQLFLASLTFRACVILRAAHSANITYEHRLTWILPEGVFPTDYELRETYKGRHDSGCAECV